MPTCHPLAGQPDHEILLRCPYDPSHAISAKRIQFHVTKCRRNHPAEKKVCCYNATHMINEPEWDHHVEICPDRGVVDSFVYATSSGRANACTIEVLPEPVVPPNEENWDDENCGTYDPALKILEAPIIHGLTGATRSERKKYRNQQRQKFRALEESVPSTDSASKIAKKIKRSSHASEPLQRQNNMQASRGKNASQLGSSGRSSASVISSDARASKSKKQRKLAA